MKPTELRIGNLVYMNLTEPNEIIEIKKGYQIDGVNDEIRKYHPIEITTEWLLNLGFEKNKYDDGFAIKHDKCNIAISLMYLPVDKSYQIEYFGIRYIGDIEVKYIHQLQNLFYAMTGVELVLAVRAATPKRKN